MKAHPYGLIGLRLKFWSRGLLTDPNGKGETYFPPSDPHLQTRPLEAWARSR